MSAKLWAVTVFTIVFAVLAWRVGDVGIAAGYLDPVGRVAAQDEAVYTYSALNMARHNGWLTPMFLGRYALYKPPLLYWVSGIPVRLFGESPFSERLPSMLAGSATAVLLFLWLYGAVGLPSALCGLLLLISNPLFHNLCRRNLMDALVMLEIMAAAFLLMRDCRLERWTSRAGFATATGAAMLTKGVAGLLPLLVLAVTWFLLAKDRRPSPKRIREVVLMSVALASPWFVYQFWVHPHWFWAEFVLTENLAFGTGSPPQTSQESAIGFYASRIAKIDPVLLVLFCVSAPALVKVVRTGSDVARLVPVAVVLVVGFAVLVFQYRNATYLLAGVPAAAILAASNRWAQGYPVALMLALAVVFCAKVEAQDRTWGIRYGAIQASSAPELSKLAARGRRNELILVNPDDDFYSALLPFRRVRYCFFDSNPNARYPLDFRHLGITVTSAQFHELDRWLPEFRARLRVFDLDSTAPVATVILFRSKEEVSTLIRSSPDADFYVPQDFADADPGAHAAVAGAGGRVFLLSVAK